MWLVKAEPNSSADTPVWLVASKSPGVSDWVWIVGVTREIHTLALMWRRREGKGTVDVVTCQVFCFLYCWWTSHMVGLVFVIGGEWGG
jgi:hypothetical protein